MLDNFPIESLPPESFIRKYSQRMSEISESPIQYHFSAILSALSVSLGRNVHFELGHHYIFPNCYILVVGESGITRKSSAVRPIIKSLRNIDEHRILPTNISNESLIPSFNSNPTRLLYLDEIRMLFDLASKSFGSGIITTLTSIHECPSQISSEFKSDYDKFGNLKETSSARNPFLSILALTTQEWLAISHENIMGGFLGRFWPIISIGEEQKIIPFPKRDDALLQDLNYYISLCNVTNGRYEFDASSQKLWSEKYTSLMRECHTNKSDQFSSFGSRLGDTVIKLCMLIMSSMPKRVGDDAAKRFVIPPAIFQSASAITDYIKDSYVNLIDELPSDRDNALEKRFVKTLKRNGGSGSRSDISKLMKLGSKEMDRIVRNLLDKGYITIQPVKTEGRNRTEYVLI